MLNKKLQTDQWDEMFYQLLKLMTKQCKNPGSGRIVGFKRLQDILRVTAAQVGWERQPFCAAWHVTTILYHGLATNCNGGALLQKLISQLEIQGEVIAQQDMNLKLLRMLPSEWKTRALIWRNKEEIETIILDDFAAHTQTAPTSRDNLSDAVICAFPKLGDSIQRTRQDVRKLDVYGQRLDLTRTKVRKNDWRDMIGAYQVEDRASYRTLHDGT
ncbi:hypothetical protein Tco_0083620 [Tanacetum coccineum]